MSEFFNVLRYQTGIQLIRKGNIPEAITFYTQKLSADPYNTFLLLELARAHFKQGRSEDTKTFLLRALEHDTSRQTLQLILELTNWRMIASSKFYNQTPVFSPCGRYVAYTSARRSSVDFALPTLSDRPGLYLFDLMTNTEELLIRDEFYNSSPCFSPDGKKLLFLSARRDTDHNKILDNRDNRGLYLMDLSDRKEEMLLDDQHKIKHASFSPDSKKIIFYCTFLNSVSGNIYLLDLADRKLKNLTPDDFESTFPSISPDGERYVFSSWRRDTNKDGQITIRDNSGIYLRDFDTLREITVAPDKFDNSFPAFSHDGRYLLFLSRRRDTNHDGIIDSQDNSSIYRYDIKKQKEQVLVTDDHYNKYPALSPDGKSLLFMSSWIRKKNATDPKKDYFEKKGIYRMDLITWKISQIVNDKYYSSQAPIISPDSAWIAYTSWRQGTARGLFMARLTTPPTKEELKYFINNNL